VPDIEMISKNRHIPIEGVNFICNSKAQTDPEFVVFFSQNKGKIRPLAESDIESHLQLARQLMNIGKPYEVEGLGMFAMKQDGTMVLHVGHYSIPAVDPASQPGRLRERTEQEQKEESEQSENSMGRGAKKALIIAGVLLLLLVAGWYFWSTRQPSESTAQQQIADSTARADSLARLADTVPAPSLPSTAILPADTTPAWKVIFRTFSGKDRVDAMKELYMKYDSTLQVETADSSTFRMFVLVKKPAADTTALKDSLAKVFSRTVTLERQGQ
jgi:type II secretory pathway pseudopilin PulG